MQFFLSELLTFKRFIKSPLTRQKYSLLRNLKRYCYCDDFACDLDLFFTTSETKPDELVNRNWLKKCTSQFTTNAIKMLMKLLFKKVKCYFDSHFKATKPIQEEKSFFSLLIICQQTHAGPI